MDGTFTRGGHKKTYCSMLPPGCPHEWWASEMTCVWDSWSIQILVLLGLFFQMVLAVLGSCRKTSRSELIRFSVWASYLLTSYCATLALGKLTTVRLNKSEEECDTELKALLAPLILLLLGNPDSITAYSVEDNRLGMRLLLNLIVTFSFVVWILWRNWKTSIPMILYFPLFLAGVIKYLETIWALYSVYDENTNMTKADFEEEKKTYSEFEALSKDVPDLKVLLNAYFRFDCLKPHLADWLKHPFFMEHRNELIDGYSPQKVFLTTDMELGFMYDVLYTKAPILYTTTGITLRVISYFCLLLTFGGYMGLFFDEHWRGPYVVYTFGLLIGVVLLETYQSLKLFCSDWVIIMNRNHFINKRDSKFLKFLAKRSLNKKKWSNEIRQFNMLDFCRSVERPWPFKVLKPFGKAENFMRYWLTKSEQIHDDVKKLLLEGMDKFEERRGTAPFTKRGEWTLGIYGTEQELGWSIEMDFDKSIIIWHIATHVCYELSDEDSIQQIASKLISEYMMFLLAQQPDILSLTTAEIIYRHTYTQLKLLLKKMSDVKDALLGSESLPYKSDGLEAPIAEGWNVLEEVRRLASELKCREDRWELISSVWVEMLCFAAYNCQLYHHAKLLRRGGDIITHVWLLLQHKTDPFRKNKNTRQTSSAPSFGTSIEIE